jgi:tetratricopeptide (TPR) repeat protein
MVAQSPPPDMRQEHSSPSESALQRGLAALERGDEALAYRYFCRAVEEEPTNDEAWFWKGITSPDVNEMVLCLGQAVGLNPANERAREDLRWAQQYRRRLEEALARPGLAPRILADTQMPPDLAEFLQRRARSQPRLSIACVVCGALIPPDAWCCPQCRTYRAVSEASLLGARLHFESTTAAPARPRIRPRRLHVSWQRRQARPGLPEPRGLPPALRRRLLAAVAFACSGILLGMLWPALQLPRTAGFMLTLHLLLPDPALIALRFLLPDAVLRPFNVSVPQFAAAWQTPFLDLRIGIIPVAVAFAAVYALALGLSWWKRTGQPPERR